MRVCVLRRQAHEHAKSQLRQDQEGVDPQNVTGGQPKGKLFCKPYDHSKNNQTTELQKVKQQEKA